MTFVTAAQYNINVLPGCKIAGGVVSLNDNVGGHIQEFHCLQQG